MITKEHLVWSNCYDDHWNGVIVDDAFAHPAKFAAGLIKRIFAHGFERGYWSKGDLIGDPFAGVACGGIIAAGVGLRYIGVELEERFVELAKKNIAKWSRIDPTPVVVQGDSREFAKIVGECSAIVTSPPFVDQLPSHDNFAVPKDTRGRMDVNHDTAYGHTPGQIGNLKEGKLDAVVTSPPFASSLTSGPSKSGCLNPAIAKEKYQGTGMANWKHAQSDYGSTPGQIGSDDTNSYWFAMKQVYDQCWLALKLGGVMAIVIKNYVKGGKIVPLCDDTWTLLQACGFEPIERIRAMLVKETTHNGLFGEVVERTERKSFFRRLAEKKGSPPIDWEEVLFIRKPYGESK